MNKQERIKELQACIYNGHHQHRRHVWNQEREAEAICQRKLDNWEKELKTLQL